MKKSIIGIVGLALLILFIIKISSFRISNTAWVAEHVIDEGMDTLQIDNQEISIEFKEDQYTFHSTLNQVEKGSFTKKGKSLVFSAEGSTEPYRVDIISASKDELILQMHANNRSRNLILKPAL